MTRTKQVVARHVLGAAALAAGMALAAPAGAAPITYAEPPDLSNGFAFPTQLGALDIGLNTVTGGISCSGLSCLSGDFLDAFRVTLAAGLRITGITLGVSNFTLAGVSASAGGLFFVDAGTLDGPTGNFLQSFANDLATTSVFTGAANGDGDLTFVVRRAAIPTSAPTISFNYLVGITVEAIPTVPPTPVPEPATLALFGAGLLGLAATSRRRPAKPGAAA